MAMRLLILLVASGAGLVAGFSKQELGERIVKTERECDRLYKLNENWNVENYNDQAVLYVDLYFLCEDSLAEDKFAYIDRYPLNKDVNPDDSTTFRVETSTGEEWVRKPPARSAEDVASMQKKLTDFMYKLGGKNNPLYKLTNIQSELSQEIVDQQVSCELLGLLVLNHPDDEGRKTAHSICLDKLNCLKEKFMAQHSFDLKQYPDFFPILYKNRGTMLNSPPRSEDGSSLCVKPVQTGYQNDLKKWTIKGGVDKIENFAESKLENLGDVGSELVEKLKKIGIGKGPTLTKEQLDDLMKNVESITGSSEEDDSEPKDKVNIFQKYAEPVFDKLADLQDQGVEKINQERQDLLNYMKTKFGPVDDYASSIVEQFKDVEDTKVKPAIKNAAESFNSIESMVKSKSKAAMAGVKETGKRAAETLKEGSVLMNKLKPSKPVYTINLSPEDDAEQKAGGWVHDFAKNVANSEYLPKNFGLPEAPLQAVLGKVGIHHEQQESEGPLSDKHIVEMLTAMKEEVKKRAQSLNIHGAEIRQAAEVLKRVVNGVLNAAKSQRGPAQGMDTDEIDHAKALVNGLVDFATKGLGDDDTEGDEEDFKNLMKEAPVPLPTAVAPEATKQTSNNSDDTSDVSQYKGESGEDSSDETQEMQTGKYSQTSQTPETNTTPPPKARAQPVDENTPE